MRPRICSLAFILALSPALWASDQQAVWTTAVPYLLRMERLRSDQDVCVLVQRDGQYHLERLHPYGIRVFEGKLPNGALASLESLLMKDRLLRLQQSDIDIPLITGDLDNLFVSVLHRDHWQNLEFSSAESRKPYEEFLNPLLKWLDDLQKEKAKELTEESGRNNCLPPKEIQLQTRSGEKISSMHTEASTVSHAYILRTLTRRFDSSRIENSCVIIRDTGVYHVRRSQQLARKETKTTVLDGTFWYEFFLMTGMREQEVMYTYWSDVNLAHATVRVSHKPDRGWTPKAYKEREIPIPTKLAKNLKAWKAKADKTCGLVFPTAGCKPKLDFLDCLKNVAERAKLDQSTFWLHKFRATFATRCLWAGVDLRTVQQWLGHSDMESTMRYLKPSRSQHVREKVNEIFA